MEWGALNSSMSLELRQSPAEIIMAASDSGDITIRLPVRMRIEASRLCGAPGSQPNGAAQVAELDAFSCEPPDGADRVYNSYKYKLVRAAFSNLPTLKDPNNNIRSKVRAAASRLAVLLPVLCVLLQRQSQRCCSCAAGDCGQAGPHEDHPHGDCRARANAPGRRGCHPARCQELGGIHDPARRCQHRGRRVSSCCVAALDLYSEAASAF